MALESAAKAYVCTNCGKTTTKKGHLCNPLVMEDTRVAVCEYCGLIASDPRHICFPKRVDLKYFCENCGRVATTKTLLCAPKSIPKGKAPAGKKKAGRASKAAAKAKKKP